MADTTALKNRIRAAIKANDNQEITGPVLQQTLLDIVDELDLNPELQEAINTEKEARQTADTQLNNLITGIKNNIDNGYVYAGIATTTTEPVSGKVFYIATVAGTYTNFSNQVLTQGINILRFNGSVWSNQQVIGIDDTPTPESNNLVKSGGITNMYGSYIENPKFIVVGLDKNKRILFGVQKDGNFLFGAGVPKQVVDYVEAKYKNIEDFLDNKVDKVEGKSLINTEYAAGVKYIENTEFSIVYLDHDGRIMFGLKKNADFYFGYGIPSQIANELINKQNTETGKGLIQTEIADILSVVENAEYISVELDADKKIMGGRKKDGTKFENMPLELLSVVQKCIHDYENKLCVELDAKGKILSYRKKDGTKVENAGLETSSIKLSDEGKEQLKEDLGVNVNDGDILTLYPKEKILPILKTFKARPSWYLPYSENYKYVNFNMLWFSDLHHVDRRLARISKFYNEYKDYIDSVLCSGDALNSYPENFEFWHDNGADSFLNVIGNHECFGGTRTVGNKTLAGWIPPGYSQKECYDKYFKDYLSETGIIIQENKAYWYKDYVLPAKTNTGEIVEGAFAYKIRLIGIDYYHWKESRTYTDGTPMEQWPDGEPLDTGQQQLWLRNLLQDAYDNDYSVICVVHNSMVNDKENTPFQSLEPYLTGADFSKTEILDEVQTFINYGGKFITWLTGHSHDDRFGVIHSHPDQLMITVGTSGNLIQGPGDRWEFPAFMDRTENTMNDDLFNLVSINTYAHAVILYRVGCPYDHHGRHLDSIAYDYINKQIL